MEVRKINWTPAASLVCLVQLDSSWIPGNECCKGNSGPRLMISLEYCNIKLMRPIYRTPVDNGDIYLHGTMELWP